jgi:hypothetical protein
MVKVIKIDGGVYQVTGESSTYSLNFTALELTVLYDWLLQHLQELEEEARSLDEPEPEDE